jgi:hypothetical protein
VYSVGHKIAEQKESAFKGFDAIEKCEVVLDLC